ncbi:DUF159-domain-containing protein [Auriculariales sp. MPI-PUGE-AT-0066]|nr:DUF159-domain-containing protein [Auriculariales sp. MPI-PUGE-AT-0066]
MCGRFALGRNRDNIMPVAGYRIQPQEWVGRDNFQPRNNIAPRSNAPVIRRMRGSEDDNRDHAGTAPFEVRSDNSTNTSIERTIMQTMQWGVIPHWQRFGDTTGQMKTINARGENLLDSDTGMWASLKKHKRCVVPVHGYFEWLKPQPPAPPTGEKKAHFVRHKNDDKLMLFAGLWDRVLLEDAPDGKELFTFTIVTVQANKELGWLHDRMPLILNNDSDIDLWLNNDKGWDKSVAQLVKPYDGPALECYPVPKEVGRVGTDSPSFVLPVSQRKDGIQAMFARQKAQGNKGSPQKASFSSSETSEGPSQHSGHSTDCTSPQVTPRPSRIKSGDSRNAQNTDESEIIEIADSSPVRRDQEVEITSSPPGSPTTTGKRKRIATPPPTTPRKKKPKTGAASPVKQKQQREAAKGTAKITSFFSKS